MGKLIIKQLGEGFSEYRTALHQIGAELGDMIFPSEVPVEVELVDGAQYHATLFFGNGQTLEFDINGSETTDLLNLIENS